MAISDNIYPIVCQPGIQRDGTTFDSDNYIDGQWCRFCGSKGRPEKMGGYRLITSWANNVPRGAFVFDSSPLPHLYVGDSNKVGYFPVDKDTGLAATPFVDRTPIPFRVNQYNQWTFDLLFNSISKTNTIIAMASQNLYAIEQEIESPIYYATAESNEIFSETGLYTSGGFMVLHPFLVVFGNDGYVGYTEPGNPTKILSTGRPTGKKIVAGRVVRGGQNSPSGLLWSLDSLIKMSYVGTTDSEFQFDTISATCSILSSSAVIEYNSIFYWIGTDCFYTYNGVVQKWPNYMAIHYFFNKLNFSQRQKVWMTKNKRFDEIWIHYPSIEGNVYNQECNKLLIYNDHYDVWYDSNLYRACGIYSQTFGKPILLGNQADINNNYDAWLHEVGVDEVRGNTKIAIESYFETSVISWTYKGPGGQTAASDKGITLYKLEPDFVQIGDMQLIVKGRRYANSEVIISDQDEYIFNNNPNSPNFCESIDVTEKRRLMTLKFSSNVVGGYYEMGNCLIVAREGDIKP